MLKYQDCVAWDCTRDPRVRDPGHTVLYSTQQAPGPRESPHVEGLAPHAAVAPLLV
jgi:hypothetical protein